MKTALIGFTGFVGSNLARQHEFTDLYNSQNIHEINGKEYDLIVSAGARAEKWRINQEPEKDSAELQVLQDSLKTVRARQFVLISTVDVYKVPIDVDEDTPVDTDGLHAYGLHRYALENFVKDTFADVTIVRLPGLFGQGLKKNVIYDLLHDNNVDRIHPKGSFQYYNLEYIWRDTKIALDKGLGLVNFATEPVQTEQVATYCFGLDRFDVEPEGVAAGSYDMLTKHAAAYGKQGKYLYSKQEVLDDIKAYVKQVKGE